MFQKECRTGSWGKTAHFMVSAGKAIVFFFFDIAVVLLEIEFAGQIQAHMPIAATTRGH